MASEFQAWGLDLSAVLKRGLEGAAAFAVKTHSGEVKFHLRASLHSKDLFDASVSLASPCCGDIGGEIYDEWEQDRIVCSECEEDYSHLSHLTPHLYLNDCGERLLPSAELHRRIEEWLAFFFPSLDPLRAVFAAQDLLTWWDSILTEALEDLKEEGITSSIDLFDEVL